MLVELGLVEQRYQAVTEVLRDGLSVTEVARRYGVTRQTVHAWLRRYARDGIGGLVDRSSRPASCPHQMPAVIEARVVELRRAHPSWGPLSIGYQLEQEGVDPTPSRSGIYRALLRHGLVDPRARRRRRSDYKRWERARAMELWQMDVMGSVRLTDDSEVKVITGIDDHSRFCVSAKIVRRATAKPVCEALADAMRRQGVPEQILTDNGKVFTGRFGPGTGEVLFDRICRENGIRHLLTAPRSPTTTGKVERFHKTIRGDFLAGKTFETLEDAQAALDGWVEYYNTERPHQGIGMVPPVERFRLAVAEPLELIESPDDAEESPSLPTPPQVTRRVTATGRISLLGFSYHVGTWLAGETVEVVSRDGVIELLHRGVLVATHARRHPPGMEPELERRYAARAPARPPTVGVPVTRKVDSSGNISFAATTYRVGNAHKGQSVQVAVIGDTVEISLNDKMIRTHQVRHDRAKEHGAFANPGGRPRRINAA